GPRLPHQEARIALRRLASAADVIDESPHGRTQSFGPSPPAGEPGDERGAHRRTVGAGAAEHAGDPLPMYFIDAPPDLIEHEVARLRRDLAAAAGRRLLDHRARARLRRGARLLARRFAWRVSRLGFLGLLRKPGIGFRF